MSKSTAKAHTFTPGDPVDIWETTTDVDGEVYGGERLDLISALIFGTEACEEIGSAHTYTIRDDEGTKSPAIKVFLTDEMKHVAELTLMPDELQRIGEWFQEQAQKFQDGDR
ncbi:hypothetical protein [Nesterenkonia sp. CF4.4]|uniref:hypothetical protein n=1 Tax=Nesterenkonia sp. CF4.4 TaxID=3373079 RepID=UPI003EE56FAA